MPDDVIGHSPRLYSGCCVLVVDSNLRTCEVVGTQFRIEGFQSFFASDLVTLRAGVRNRTLDIMVFNPVLSDGNCIEVIEDLRPQLRGVTLIAIVDRVDLANTVGAMQAGAIDVLEKPVDGERLVRIAKREIRRNVQVVSDARGGIVIKGFAALTPREREVLERVMKGRTNKETGRELGISPRTVEVHRTVCMRKLGARNTADLLRIVLTS